MMQNSANGAIIAPSLFFQDLLVPFLLLKLLTLQETEVVTFEEPTILDVKGMGKVEVRHVRCLMEDPNQVSFDESPDLKRQVESFQDFSPVQEVSIEELIDAFPKVEPVVSKLTLKLKDSIEDKKKLTVFVVLLTPHQIC